MRLGLLVSVVGIVVGIASAFEDEIIRCRVCDRAMHHVWGKATELRHHCRHTYDDPDVRCDYAFVHPWAVTQMAWGVCEALPTTYQAVLNDKDFRLIATEEGNDPVHTEEAAEAIKQSCIRWLHTEHTAEKIGEVVKGFLEEGKTAEVILASLKKRFCQAACSQHAAHVFTHEDL